MTRPPRRATAALGLRALWRPYAVGCTLAVAVIGAYLGAIGAGWPSAEARAFGFVVLLASQPFLVLISRSPDEPMWRSGIRSTRTLLVAMVVMVAVTAAVVYVAPLADLLQLEPFAPATWLGVLALAAGSTLWTEPLKAARHRRLRRGGGPTGGVPTR